MMKRYKDRSRQLCLITFLLLALCSSSIAASKLRCAKRPKETNSDRSEGDNGFRVMVNGSPKLYRPNQRYTVTIRSIGDDPTKFQDFMLAAEASSKFPVAIASGLQGETQNLGTFELMPNDATVKFSLRCSDAVEASSSLKKEEIQVYWHAPPRGSGCIDFRAMVEERQGVWFSDDNGLTYKLCEDNSPLKEPPSISPCCACDEAKYEAVFEGIWSRQTHPRDFPPDEWRTEFSQLIGASHSINYTLWDYGRPATPALRTLGERGVTSALEMEMKRNSKFIRSVIKAHGLQQRSNVQGQTFAVFRTDPNNHLLSFASKMIPSPDWIVGVSKENLCLSDCRWVDNRVVDLFPWDIGTQQGLQYNSPYEPQRPWLPIQRITSSNPNDPDSPFFDKTSAPMRPVARLHLIKHRQYPKACPPGKTGPQNSRPRGYTSGLVNSGNNVDNSDNYGSNYGSSDYGNNINDNYGNNNDNNYGSDNYGSNTYGNNDAYGSTINDGYGSTNNDAYGNTHDAYGNTNNDAYGNTNNDAYGNTNDGSYGNSYDNSYGSDYRGSSDYNRGNNEAFERDSSNYGTNNYGDNNRNAYGYNSNEGNNNNRYEESTGNSYVYGVGIGDPMELDYEGDYEEERINGEVNAFGSYDDDDNDLFGGYNEDNNNYGLNNNNNNDICATSSWSAWSECSATCGRASSRERSRTFLNPSASRGCRRTRLREKEACRYLPECEPINYGLETSTFLTFVDDQQQDEEDVPAWMRQFESDDLVSTSYTYGNRAQNLPRPASFVDVYGSEQNNFDDVFADFDNDDNDDGRNANANSYVYGLDPLNIRNTDALQQLERPRSSDCRVSQWNSWSDCSASCGLGTRTRSRIYSEPQRSRDCSEELTAVESCRAPSDSPNCKNDALDIGNYDARGNNGYNSNNEYNSNMGGNRHFSAQDPECRVTQWSQWSPCSVKCGSGYKMRTRLFREAFVEQRTCDVALLDKRGCRRNECDSGQINAEADEWLVAIDAKPQDDDDTHNFVHDMTPDDENVNNFNSDAICLADPDEGPCRGRELRWYYNKETGECSEFFYGRCAGNKNNFESREECVNTCGSMGNQRNPLSGRWNGGLQSMSLVKEDLLKDDSNRNDEESWYESSSASSSPTCVMTAWTEWSDCSQTCGIGTSTRRRRLLVGDPECRERNARVVRRKKCRRTACPVESDFWYTGSWRHMSPRLGEGE